MNGPQYPGYQQPYPGQPAYPVQPARNDPEYIAYLEQRIVALEGRLPNTNLVHPRFMKRAWAVWGHAFVANLILSLIFGVVGGVLALLLGGLLGGLMMTSGF